MSTRLAYSSKSSQSLSVAQPGGAMHALWLAQALAWAAMVLGLSTAGVLLVQRFLVGA